MLTWEETIEKKEVDTYKQVNCNIQLSPFLGHLLITHFKG